MANDYTGNYTGITYGGQMKAQDVTDALNKMEKVEYKTTELSASSTDTQYPSAKTVYTGLSAKQDKIAAGTANNIVAYSGTAGTLNALTRVTGVSAAASALDTAVPTEKAVATALAAKANAADVQAKLPVGTILMYNGTGWQDNVTLPGWYKCDGANGTPNLVNKFVCGGAASGGTGGSNALTAAMLPKHTHTIYTSATKNTDRTADKTLTGNLAGAYGYPNPSTFNVTGTDGIFSINASENNYYGNGSADKDNARVHIDATHNHTGGANNDNSSTQDTNTSNMPAYYALIFIMRVS
ncbi:MAG: hypothetical protein LBQ83_05315 [Candidatus Margulisbacteria bacterium]|jgi:hypothetical protein|nr:hypothetical protein [Candidatus Margulisiibacteriota bacterium]